MKKLLTFMLTAALGLGLAGCGSGEVKVFDKYQSSDFKALGRTYFADGKIYCALSGTGVEFKFHGSECTVTVEGDGNAANFSQADNFARIGIYLNGERVVDDMIDRASETYTVLNSDVETDATVKIVKLSESAMSTFAITDITINGGGPEPTENKDLLVEFVGDSITCGYGVDDLDPNHHFATRTEDCTKAYAIKTAELLDADYSLVSFSGYGIISGYSDGQTKISAQTVPQYYEKYGYSWSAPNGFVPADVNWGFGRKPDVVVINLGTNDDSYCKNIPERCDEFRTEYVKFLKTVRKDNPDAVIVCALGIMGQNLYPSVEAAVNDFCAETGDEKVYSMMFDNQNQADGIAADWHPSEVTHGKAAEKLAEFIRGRLEKEEQ